MGARGSQAASTVLSAASLGKNFGYRLDGDSVTLNADIARCNPDAANCNWRVQLWACRGPFQGGHIDGVKVADVAAPEVVNAPTSIVATTLATFPPAGQYRSMVMAVASQDGKFATIHDYANFPLTQSFLSPRLLGNVGFRLDGDTVKIDVEAIDNSRDSDNLSGTLSLELWALTERYEGGDFNGVELAGVNIGTLAGQCRLHDLSFTLPLNSAMDGERYVVLMLREWTAGGYITRDFTCFAQPVQFKGTRTAVEKSNVAQPATLLNTVIDHATAPAKKRARATAAVAASTPTAAEDQAPAIKKDVLRGRGRGRKLLAKVAAVAKSRGTPNSKESAGSPERRN